MSGCSVTRPIQISGARLVSSNVPETEYPEWGLDDDYAVGARVIRDGKVWESVQTPNIGFAPGANALYWADKGASNRMAMFDAKISTQTVNAGEITVVIKPGFANSIELYGLEGGALDVVVRNGLDGPIVYEASRDLDSAEITSLYEYFYEPPDPLTQAIFTRIPPYGNAHITIKITGTGIVKIGFLSVGMSFEIGDAQYGATVEIIDYSRKDTNKSGETTLVVGEFSKRLSAEIAVDGTRLNKVMRVLEGLRATPCSWITSDVTGLELLTVLGFYRSVPLTVENFLNSRIPLEIEGLI